MKLPDLVDHLRGLADKGMALGPLLRLLLPHLGTSILDKKLYVKVAQSMVKTLPLGQCHWHPHRQQCKMSCGSNPMHASMLSSRFQADGSILKSTTVV